MSSWTHTKEEENIMKVLKGVIVLTLFIVPLLPMPARAACVSCWWLKGVSLQLISGEKLEGHVPWNGAWLYGQETKASFPDLLLEPLQISYARQIKLYEKLQRVAYPKKGLVVATREPRVVYLDSLKAISSRPDSLEGYAGAGLIPVVSSGTANRLKREPPLAFCAGEPECCSVIYWITYNPQVDENDIAVLCKMPLVALLAWNEYLESNGIIRLEFPYD